MISNLLFASLAIVGIVFKQSKFLPSISHHEIHSACTDLINVSTGVSDCSAQITFCNNPVFYDTMTTQCPKTCGRCAADNNNNNNSGTNTGATTSKTSIFIVLVKNAQFQLAWIFQILWPVSPIANLPLISATILSITVSWLNNAQRLAIDAPAREENKDIVIRQDEFIYFARRFILHYIIEYR